MEANDLQENRYSVNSYWVDKRIKLLKYSNEKIVKALLLAPLPLLFFIAVLFIVMNQEYSLYSILVVLVGHGLVYLAYCILTVPFSFIFSIILNRYNILNLLTICITSLVIAAPFFILFGWSHTGEISKEWWKMMCAELAGDFHLGDSRQLTDKSLLPFDLVS